MKSKVELQAELKEIRARKNEMIDQKMLDSKNIHAAIIKPLEDALQAKRKEQEAMLDSRYNPLINPLIERERGIIEQITLHKIQEANSIWHKDGTIVHEYNHKNGQWYKTGETGTVKVYDGTQQLPRNIVRYSKPSKGDVLIFINKKDGSMGIKMEVAVKYGSLQHPTRRWCADGETPDNNLFTNKKNSDDYQY